MSKELGRFNVRRDVLMESISSKISGEKPRFVEVKRGDCGYVVSSVGQESFPENIRRYKTHKIRKSQIVVVLSCFADLSDWGIGKRYFLKRTGQGANLGYESFIEN